MRKIQLKDAKANFSAVVDQATQGKPSVITLHGEFRSFQAVLDGLIEQGLSVARSAYALALMQMNCVL